MDAAGTGIGDVEKCFLLQMFSKTSVDEAFMHHLHRGAAPGPCWKTSVLQTPSLPTHGKNPAGARGDGEKKDKTVWPARRWDCCRGRGSSAWRGTTATPVNIWWGSRAVPATQGLTGYTRTNSITSTFYGSTPPASACLPPARTASGIARCPHCYSSAVVILTVLCLDTEISFQLASCLIYAWALPAHPCST